MDERRHTKVSETIAHLAADFFAREAGKQSLITVTRTELDEDMKKATVYISVLPESEEQKAIDFTKRSRSDFRSYMLEHSFLRPAPTIDFEIDYGEKNRQRVDELTKK